MIGFRVDRGDGPTLVLSITTSPAMLYRFDLSAAEAVTMARQLMTARAALLGETETPPPAPGTALA